MGIFEQNARLFDMHCHLGFVEDVEAVRACLETCSATALSCTVSPLRYVQSTKGFADVAACVVALGLHPWQVVAAASDALASELVHFEELAPTTRFIGEVGLDYAGDRDEPATRARQRDTFARVLAACDAPSMHPRKLVSLHAVHAADEVLAMLEARCFLAHHDCIFHWFAGTSAELKRAIDAGYFFSIGPRMLATKRGREYARIIPVSQLLLETDSPAHPGDAWSCEGWLASLQEALKDMADIREVSVEELAHTLARTSESLIRPA